MGRRVPVRTANWQRRIYLFRQQVDLAEMSSNEHDLRSDLLVDPIHFHPRNYGQCGRRFHILL